MRDINVSINAIINFATEQYTTNEWSLDRDMELMIGSQSTDGSDRTAMTVIYSSGCLGMCMPIGNDKFRISASGPDGKEFAKVVDSPRLPEEAGKLRDTVREWCRTMLKNVVDSGADEGVA